MIRRHIAARKARKEAAQEYRAQTEDLITRWDADMSAAVDLAIEEARRAAVPGIRPRVDVEDVLDTLARPMFSDQDWGPQHVAGQMREHLRGLGDAVDFDTDAYGAEYNPMRPPPSLTGGVPPSDPMAAGVVEVRLIGPEAAVQQLTEAFVAAAGESRATSVSYRPARDGAAVRARFMVNPPEVGE